MTKKYILLDPAYAQLDDIYEYTKTQWGADQAKTYVGGLFDCFEQIDSRQVLWRAIPVQLEIDGYFTRYEKHYVYWKKLSGGRIVVVAILHERMHQIEWLNNSFK